MIKCTECGEKTEKYMEFRQGEICYDCLGTDDNDLKWLRSFACYISDKWNEVYNDAMKFADKEVGK